ncbi:hypothetical protein D3C86_1158250 [compost metagenome]
MFSRITIESSTRIPTTRERAISVIRFSDIPNTYMKMNVGIIEAGRAMSTNRELRILCKNSSITTDTMIIASTRSNITALADSNVYVLWSDEMLNFNLLEEYVFSSSAIFTRISLLTSTAFASVCFITWIPIDGIPLMRLIAVASC